MVSEVLASDGKDGDDKSSIYRDGKINKVRYISKFGRFLHESYSQMYLYYRFVYRPRW